MRKRKQQWILLLAGAVLAVFVTLFLPGWGAFVLLAALILLLVLQFKNC